MILNTLIRLKEKILLTYPHLNTHPTKTISTQEDLALYNKDVGRCDIIALIDKEIAKIKAEHKHKEQ